MKLAEIMFEWESHGSIRIGDQEIRLGTEYWDFYSGQHVASVLAIPAEHITKENAHRWAIGRLDFSRLKGGPAKINMIEVLPEYRRKGVAKQMLAVLAKEVGSENIEWGMMTPDGSEFKKSIETVS